MDAQRRATNTLATTGQAVNQAYEAYLTMVVQGSVRTNGVPAVSLAFRNFQAIFAAAVATAEASTNFVTTPPELALAAGAVTSKIQEEKNAR